MDKTVQDQKRHDKALASQRHQSQKPFFREAKPVDGAKRIKLPGSSRCAAFFGLHGAALCNCSAPQRPALNAEPLTADAPFDADSILTDDQLGRAGLIKIEAFVRTKTSAAASRKAKQRAKEKAEGIQTVTLTVPAAAKEQLKAVAAEVTSGKSLIEAVQSVTSHNKPSANDR